MHAPLSTVGLTQDSEGCDAKYRYTADRLVYETHYDNWTLRLPKKIQQA